MADGRLAIEQRRRWHTVDTLVSGFGGALGRVWLYDEGAGLLRLQASAAPETSGSGNRLDRRRVERAGIDLIFFFSY